MFRQGRITTSRSTPYHSVLAFAMIGVLTALFLCRGSAAQSSNEAPRELQDVTIVEKLNEQVPLDLRFKNADGKAVQLRDYFPGDKPVILTLNYYRCPQLCSLQLRALVSALKDMDWTVGEDFNIVTVSFAPNEGPEAATSNKKGYLNKYDRDVPEDGWAFLTGEQASIDNLVNSVGFQYNYVEETGEYAHKAALIFLTPKGVVSRYLPDINYKPKDIRLALVEAGEGSIGSPMDKALLFSCFQYSSDKSGYVVSAWKIMRAGAILTLVLLAVGLTVLFTWGSKKQSQTDENEAWPTQETDGRVAGEV